MHSALPVSFQNWKRNEKSQSTHYDQVRAKWGSLGTQDNEGFKRSLQKYESLSREVMSDVLLSRPSFLHGDLHDGQIIVNEQKQTLIDFGESREAQALLDAAIYCYHTLRTRSNIENISQFISGYSEYNPLNEKEKEILTFFLLYTSLRSVEWYVKFRPRDIEYPLSHLPTINSFLEEEHVWK